MAAKREKMDEDKLSAFIDAELQRTIGYGFEGDEISAERLRNLERYLNRPLGDEEDGRSQLQSSDVQDVVESLLPDTLAPFISSDKTVEFKPGSQEDEKLVDFISAYVNHIYTADNDGMMIDYTWQKDAYISKNGFVFAEWVKKEKTRRSFAKVYEQGLKELVEDEEIEILKYGGYDAQGKPIDAELLEAKQYDPGTTCFEVDYRRTWKEGRIVVRNIPPEFVLVSNTAVTEENATLIGWQEQVTISDLREEGYSEDKIKALEEQIDEEVPDISGERNAREQTQGGRLSDGNRTSINDPASRKVWRAVLWTRVDYDGDGKTELRKIVRAGVASKGGKILLNEEADEKPIVGFCAIPMPHQLIGRCPADQAVSIQDGKTVLTRMVMDATYHTVHPRQKVVVDEAYSTEDTWSDIQMDIPGAPVRVLRLDAVEQLRDNPDVSVAYQFMEYLDRARETRTPVTRQDQGIDANLLQDKTATDATIQANATARRKELILRLYAHARVRLFKLILRLVIKHQDKPRMLRLTNEWVEIDPRYWNADMDAVPSVGLGTGTKDQRLQTHMLIANEQTKQMQLGTGLVTPENMYNTYEALIKDSGLSSPELYFTKPQEGQPAQPADPAAQEQAAAQAEEAQKAEAEKIQQAIDQAYEQGKQEGMALLEQEKLKANVQVKGAEIQSKERMKAAELATKEKMHGMDVAVKAKQAAMQAERPAAQ